MMDDKPFFLHSNGSHGRITRRRTLPRDRTTRGTRRLHYHRHLQDGRCVHSRFHKNISFTGNINSHVRDGRCKHYIVLRTLCTRNISRVWLKGLEGLKGRFVTQCVRLKNKCSSFSCVMSHSHSVWPSSSAHSFSALFFLQ